MKKKHFLRMSVFLCGFIFSICLMNPLSAQIVIDHNCIDPDKIPLSCLDSIKALDILFMHRFIGDGIMEGFTDLAVENAARYSIDTIYTPNIGWFYENSGIGHFSYGFDFLPESKCSKFNEKIRDQGFGGSVDIAFFMFSVEDFICQDWWGEIPADSIWHTFYKPTMQALEADYPEVTFVWWTAPLNDRWGNDEKGVFNTLARNYCANNGRVLFDLADIESHDTLGEPVQDVDGFEGMWHDYSIDGTRLNGLGRKRVASALWRLFAFILGWSEGAEEGLDKEQSDIRLEVIYANGALTIRYYLPEAGRVGISIFDACGRRVASLAEGIQTSGEHRVVWDRAVAGNGVYFIGIQHKDFTWTEKLLILSQKERK
ncbi:T9SS type A sorting domain-containing protein [candidate division WOR-3 bacterium]|nr:T9SS type A sorting domain-containing protein [candidate division WOR-3 bacterium]